MRPRTARGTTQAMPKRVRETGFEALFPGLSSLLEVVETLGEKIRALDRQIAQISKQRYPETALLRYL